MLRSQVPDSGRSIDEGAFLKSIRQFSRPRTILLLLLVFPIASARASPGQAQAPSSKHHSAGDNHVTPALLISDIHFDPFHDPAKLQQLVDAPTSQWRAILTAAPSSNQSQAFDSLQQECKIRGVDTPYPLLHSSLQAMRSREPNAKFMTVSGDLIAHAFTCKYKTLLPKSTQSDYQTFILKTISFVAAELRASFPGIPIYVALGNNDTDCGDYRLDAGSDFLAQAGKIVAKGLLPSQQRVAIQQFAAGGYYSITMAAPMRETRLVIVNDLFLSPNYATCGGAPNESAATAEMSWLKGQLTEARQLGQKVWVMGHIPPGVDTYATLAAMKNICAQAKPQMFLSSDKMADLLIEYADVIRLGIFAHTHMDEIRLLQPEDSDTQTSTGHSVAIKMVPSISPVDGNNPSFTIARVNSSNAVLQDYEVVTASNQTGINTTWSTEYDYARTYHEAQFSPASVKKLTAEFKSDRESKQESSQAYLHNYFVGDRSSELKPFWPQYVCGMGNSTAKAFAACVCSIVK
jgi:sphingomyelin phosphodiesterase acid-like 3